MQVIVIDHIAGTTYQVASSNTVATISATVLLTTAGRKIKGMLVECDLATGYAVRYGFNADPDAATLHRLGPGQALEIEGNANCRGFRFVNDVDGENAVLIVTPRY